jgi:putative transposase
MTVPRPVGLGDTTMAQKRCYRGEYRLRPDLPVRQLIEYLLAYCADKYDQDLHDFIFMFNHDHIESTDPLGKRPLFLQQFHSLLARAINCLFHEGDSVFSGQRYSAQVLAEGEDVFKKSLYLHLNCVEAGIVRHPRDYHGVLSWNMEYDRPKVVRRPDFFFSKNMPETMKLVIRRPEQVRPELGDRELRRAIRAEVTKRAGDIVAAKREAGESFTGFDRAMRRPRHQSAGDRMSPGGHKSGIRPHVSAGDVDTRIAALQGLKTFWKRHALAMARWRAGDRKVVFPYGTYKMRVLHNANIEPKPA